MIPAIVCRFYPEGRTKSIIISLEESNILKFSKIVKFGCRKSCKIRKILSILQLTLILQPNFAILLIFRMLF